jgi:hypothetical protein
MARGETDMVGPGASRRQRDPRNDAKRVAATRTYPLAAAIIAVCRRAGTPMEAEQLNAIANSLADLADRAAQLRRYL